MATAETILETGNVVLKIAAVLVLMAATLVASRLIFKHLVWPRVRKTESNLDDRLLHLFESFLMIFIVLLGLQEIIRLFRDYFGTYAGFTDDVFFLFYWALGIYLIFRVMSIVSNWYLSKIPLKERGGIDKRMIYSLRNVLMLIVFLFALLILLDHFEITSSALTAMVAALGIGGIIVGFAAKETISNIITGIVLLIDRPFKIGDRIGLEKLETWGDVLELGWRSTRILTRDNRLVVIPNSVIGADMITNYSIPEKMFRVETHVIVSYGPDIEYVRELIVDAMKNEDWIMQDKPVQALLLEFTESGVKFRARCWIEDYVETRVSEDRLNTAIYKALISKNIAMPSSDLVIYFADPEGNRIVPWEK